MHATPTPPDAQWIRTLSPFFPPPTETSALYAVKYGTPRAAPSSKLRPAGSFAVNTVGAVAYSA